MTEEKDKYDDIEKFLHQPDDSELKRKFQEDKSFAKDVNLYKGLKKAITDKDAIAMEELFGEVENELFPKEKKVRSLRILWMAAAASVVLAAAVWSLQLFAEPSAEELFANHFEPYKLGFVDRGEDNLSAIEEANYYYASQDFKEATLAIEALKATDKTNQYYSFYLALSYIGNSESTKAIPLLQEVLQSEQLDLHDPAEWYIAMAFLQQGQKDNAKKQLEKISKKSSKFQQLAHQLLDEF